MQGSISDEVRHQSRRKRLEPGLDGSDVAGLPEPTAHEMGEAALDDGPSFEELLNALGCLRGSCSLEYGFMRVDRDVPSSSRPTHHLPITLGTGLTQRAVGADESVEVNGRST